MDIIYELINGTVPSHPITLSVDVRLTGGAVLTIHQLEYRGSHANRTSWQQSVTGAYVMIRNDNGLIATFNLTRGRKQLCYAWLARKLS